MRENIESINEWAEQFAYHELDVDRQATVLSEMSIDEYDELHKTASVFARFLQEEASDLEPNKESLAVLQNASKNKKKLGGFFAVRIPAYQAVAACFLVALGSYFLFGKTETNTVVVEKDVPIYEVVRDTIYREIPVVEYITKTVTKKVPSIERTSIPISTYVPQEDYALREPSETPSMNDISKSFGNTVVSAESLERFKVKM